MLRQQVWLLDDAHLSSIVTTSSTKPTIATTFGVTRAIPNPNISIAVKIGLRTHPKTPRADQRRASRRGRRRSATSRPCRPGRRRSRRCRPPPARCRRPGSTARAGSPAATTTPTSCSTGAATRRRHAPPRTRTPANHSAEPDRPLMPRKPVDPVRRRCSQLRQPNPSAAKTANRASAMTGMTVFPSLAARVTAPGVSMPSRTAIGGDDQRGDGIRPRPTQQCC